MAKKKSDYYFVVWDALKKAKLTPEFLSKELALGLKDPSGKIYSNIRDMMIKEVEKLSDEDLNLELNIDFRDAFLKEINRYDLTTEAGRDGFCFYLYNTDEAVHGNRVIKYAWQNPYKYSNLK